MSVRRLRSSPRRWPARTSAVALVLATAGVCWYAQTEPEIQGEPVDTATPAPEPHPNLRTSQADPIGRPNPFGPEQSAPVRTAPNWQNLMVPRVQWAPPA